MTLRKPLFLQTSIPGEAYSEEMAAVDSLALGGLAMSGNITMGGNPISGAGGNLITGMGGPTNAGDAANKAYVDSVAQGLSPKLPVKAIATANVAALSGTMTIDGVPLLAGDRVLLTAQSSPNEKNNGIWVVQAGAWVRPADFSTGTHAAHAFVFVEGGLLYADTGWVCTTNGPTDVIDTDPLAWVQFSAAGVILAGAGLDKTGNTIFVKKGDGIEVTSNSAATNIALAAGPTPYPGLQLAGSSPNKTLAVLPDPAGPINVVSGGVNVLLDGATLSKSGSGLKVLGLPSLFTVNGTAVGANVTSANLDTLVNGGSADALHNHSTGAATETPKVENTMTVNEAIGVGDPVYITNTNNRVGKGDTIDAKAKIVGVSRTAQAVIGNTCEVVSVGPASGVLSTATAGDAYYLATGGGLSTSLPGAAKRVIRCGLALNASDLFVQIADFGKKAS